MRTPTDALRSLKRYAATSLDTLVPPPPDREWEVRLTDEKGAFRRPFCRVEAAGPAVNSGDARNRILTESFQLLCHTIETATPEEARFEAGKVEQAMHQMFGVGTHRPSYRVRGGVGAQNILRGHPQRVPLFDYAGKAPDEVVTDSDRDPRDFMRVVTDPQVEAMRDEVDEMLWVVVTSIRMSWTVSAAVVSGGVIVESVPVEATS